MPTIKATELIDRAAFLLQDSGNVRWTRTELLDWFNEGEREIVVHKPNTYVKTVATLLAAGAKQAMPTDAVTLVDIPRNTNGLVIRVVARGIFDSYMPGWYVAPAATVIKHYMYTPLIPKEFHVYPPANGHDSRVDIVYVAIPDDINEGDEMLLDDIYGAPLVNYMLYRSYSKDAEYAANAQAAAAYYQQFMSLLGVKTGAEAATIPSQTQK